ncbi:MAG: hypothetical protein WC895_02105 [Candidatus Shapirobacteria bacterium]|jgi:hypothetical protein
MNYLKDEQYYSDLYDLHTIEICLDWEKEVLENCGKDKDFAKFSEPEQNRFKNIMVKMPVYYKKGERYRDRENTINQWIQKDKEKQDKYNNAKEPTGIYCKSCNWAMESTTKDLYDFTEEPLRVLFFFECPNCHKRRGIFNDGKEYESKVRLCPKCSSELDIKYKKKNEVSTFIEKCKNCDYKIVDKTDFKAWDEQQKKRKERQEYLLKTFRNEFCMSKEDGNRYIADQTQTQYFMKHDEERKNKEADPRYQKAKNLNKLKVIELQKIVQEVINTNGFNQLNFGVPEIDRQVIISFNVQEMRLERKEYDACRDLKRGLTKALEDTNWRLMSDGIGGKLGILYGKLKGYESEDDLISIVKSSKSHRL